MKTPLRLLLLEDDPVDAELVAATLSEAGVVCTAQRVDTREAFLNALRVGGYDLILADYSIPGFDGMTALGLAREYGSGDPFPLCLGDHRRRIGHRCHASRCHRLRAEAAVGTARSFRAARTS